jgi:hypothetical protein
MASKSLVSEPRVSKDGLMCFQLSAVSYQLSEKPSELAFSRQQPAIRKALPDS